MKLLLAIALLRVTSKTFDLARLAYGRASMFYRRAKAAEEQHRWRWPGPDDDC